MTERQRLRTICHITTQSAWEQAVGAGLYSPDTLETERFIHCSTAEQVLTVANTFYRGENDLVLLFIDEESVEAPIYYEPPADNLASAERFPHIYGPINLDAVIWALPFVPDAQGQFYLP